LNPPPQAPHHPLLHPFEGWQEIQVVDNSARFELNPLLAIALIEESALRKNFIGQQFASPV